MSAEMTPGAARAHRGVRAAARTDGRHAHDRAGLRLAAALRPSRPVAHRDRRGARREQGGRERRRPPAAAEPLRRARRASPGSAATSTARCPPTPTSILPLDHVRTLHRLIARGLRDRRRPRPVAVQLRADARSARVRRVPRGRAARAARPLARAPRGRVTDRRRRTRRPIALDHWRHHLSWLTKISLRNRSIVGLAVLAVLLVGAYAITVPQAGAHPRPHLPLPHRPHRRPGLVAQGRGAQHHDAARAGDQDLERRQGVRLVLQRRHEHHHHRVRVRHRHEGQGRRRCSRPCRACSRCCPPRPWLPRSPRSTSAACRSCSWR